MEGSRSFVSGGEDGSSMDDAEGSADRVPPPLMGVDSSALLVGSSLDVQKSLREIDEDAPDVEGRIRARDDLIVRLEEDLHKAHSERRALAMRRERDAKMFEEEFARLGRKMEEQVRGVTEKQQHLEAVAPNMRQQLHEAKTVIRRHIGEAAGGAEPRLLSQAAYQRIQATRDEEVTLSDFLLFNVEEYTRVLRGQLEEARKASEENKARADESAHGLRRAQEELRRAQDALAEVHEGAGNNVARAQARMRRLEGELQDATVRAEVNAAKAKMYEDLAKSFNELDKRYKSLALSHAKQTDAVTKLEREAQGMRDDLREARHHADLLQLEKTFLERGYGGTPAGNQEPSAGARGGAASSTGHVLTEEALKRLLDAATSGRGDGGGRGRAPSTSTAEADVTHIAKHASRSMERLLREAVTSKNAQIEQYRDARDSAVSRAEALQRDLSSLKDEFQGAITRHRKCALDQEAEISRLQGELRATENELRRVAKFAEDTISAKRRTDLESDMVREEVRILHENFRDLDVQRSSRNPRASSNG